MTLDCIKLTKKQNTHKNKTNNHEYPDIRQKAVLIDFTQRKSNPLCQGLKMAIKYSAYLSVIQSCKVEYFTIFYYLDRLCTFFKKQKQNLWPKTRATKTRVNGLTFTITMITQLSQICSYMILRMASSRSTPLPS